MDIYKSEALAKMSELEVATSLNNGFESNVFNVSTILPRDEIDQNFLDMLNYPLIVILLTVSLLLLCIPLKKCWHFWNIKQARDPTSTFSSLPLPPGEFGYPIIGETLQWAMQGNDFNASRRKMFGNIFKTNVIGLRMIRVTGHEYVKQILQGEHTKVTTIWPINIRKLVGINGMINSAPEVHKIKRKIACKAFTSAALNGYIPQMQQVIRRHIKSLGDCNGPRVHDKMLRLTYDLAAQALLGLDPETPGCDKLVDSMYTMIENVFSIPVNLPGTSFNKALQARALVLELLEDHIVERKKLIIRDINEGKDSVERKSAFDVIIKETIMDNLRLQDSHSVEADESVIDNLTLKEIAIELMFAGYATSASTLTSCTLELTRNPDVLRKLEEELIQYDILSEEGEENFPEIDLRLVHQLTYMEKVLKETLRLRPPILGGYRRAKKTFQLGDYRIPKDWTVVYNIRDTHEFEFDSQENFQPERFDTKFEGEDKYRFIPFGGGARMCIGREYARLIIKLTLIEMIRSFDHWDLVHPGLPKMKPIPALHPADGLPCHFYPREKYGAPKIQMLSF